jgi:dTDP-4-dehydrorhamnose reductase
VHTVLDLLVDREFGVWHLANEGAVTWFDLARSAAALIGRAADGIVPAEAARVRGPAARPPFSALSSQRARLMRPLDAALDAFGAAWPNVAPAMGANQCA